jgi:hypothetical protein
VVMTVCTVSRSEVEWMGRGANQRIYNWKLLELDLDPPQKYSLMTKTKAQKRNRIA